jgi:hypothetical protein
MQHAHRVRPFQVPADVLCRERYRCTFGPPHHNTVSAQHTHLDRPVNAAGCWGTQLLVAKLLIDQHIIVISLLPLLCAAAVNHGTCLKATRLM